MSFRPAATLAELSEDPLPVTLLDDDGQEIQVAIVASDGEIFAIRDLCSHARVSLSEGLVEDGCIECWVHGSRFDLRTGTALNLPAIQAVPVYPVKIEGEQISVDVSNPKTTALK
uniref:non-heme iron oxygenase ferredoxin subunit n=1 Tax=Vaginimicrobium propionicum TaxID=1871034 RepID=UPI000970BF9F|nr:non-heme iron oxygenase ferredoxin subunit [Vaginimicrobium propionicum]